MLESACSLAKIRADTAENETHSTEICAGVPAEGGRRSLSPTTGLEVMALARTRMRTEGL